MRQVIKDSIYNAIGNLQSLKKPNGKWQMYGTNGQIDKNLVKSDIEGLECGSGPQHAKRDIVHTLIPVPTHSKVYNSVNSVNWELACKFGIIEFLLPYKILLCVGFFKVSYLCCVFAKVLLIPLEYLREVDCFGVHH